MRLLAPLATKPSTAQNANYVPGHIIGNDSVMTSAEAESEEKAMAIARTTANAFYGSRPAMFEYTVYPLSPQTRRPK
jgi:hypothetical protein